MIRRMPVNADVSFVNLIDVTLVLLIIFMITAPAMNQMLDVGLPKAKASSANITEGIVITIKKDGAVYIDNKKVGDSEFNDTFRGVWEDHAGEPVYINSDESVPYGDVVGVISRAKSIGVENIGLVVQEVAEKQ